MGKTLLVVLIGRKETGQVDHFQLLQEEEARSEAQKANVAAEIVFAPGFDHLRVIRKRLTDASAPLAIGVRNACRALSNVAHREMLLKAHLLGVDGCPDFGAKLVDSGELYATVVAPANTGEAIRLLRSYWESGRALPLRAATTPRPYPEKSVA